MSVHFERSLAEPPLHALLGSEGECECPHAGIARHQGQHVPSSRRTGNQTNHPGPIEARHSICADVCSARFADRLPVEQHGDRRIPRCSRLHDQVHLAGGEREHDLAGALPELDVLAFAPPVAVQCDSPGLTSVSPDVGLVGDPGVRGLAGSRKRRRLLADSR